MPDASPRETVLYVCTTCRREGDAPEAPRAGARLFEALRAGAADRPLAPRIEPIECLSGCKRPCTVAVASAGRWTYVYGDLEPADSAGIILDGVEAYSGTSDGLVPWRERPAAFRTGAVARIPPFPERPEAAE